MAHHLDLVKAHLKLYRVRFEILTTPGLNFDVLVAKGFELRTNTRGTVEDNDILNLRMHLHIGRPDWL